MTTQVKRPYLLRLESAKALECEITEKPNGNGKIAAVYGRVSSGIQAIQSIYANQRQRDMANRASDLNYSAIVSIFADLQGVSGALGPAQRPGFATLCRLVEGGIADDVFVMDFTRLVRDHIIGLDFAQICIKEHVRIIDEAGRTLDPSDKVGLILYVIQLSESVEERNRINSRLQISRRKKAEQGRNPGMSIAVGFYIDPRLGRDDPGYHRLMVYEPHAKFVRPIGRYQAQRHLAELYFRSVGAAQAKDLSKLFGWKMGEVEKALDDLVQSKMIKRNLEIAGQAGQWAALNELA